MRSLLPFIVTTLFIINFYPSTAQEEEHQNKITGMHSISSHELYDHVKTMASDQYGGRLTGTAEYDSIAQWLVRHFEKWGVQPGAEEESYMQWFDIPYTKVFPGCSVSMHLPAGEGEVVKHYDYVSEFIPGATSADGTVKAEVVYAGYGISAPELDYDDYQNIDVKDKIVLIEREAPLNPRKYPEEFEKWEPYSYHQYKLNNAVKHGAAGMIYNYGPIVNPNNAYHPDFIYSHVVILWFGMFLQAPARPTNKW